MNRELLLRGNAVPFQIETAADETAVAVNGVRAQFTVQELGAGRLVLLHEDCRIRARVVRHRDRLWVWLAGNVYEFQVPADDGGALHQHGAADGAVRAPMPGTLVKLFVAVGDAVETGQVVAIVEAMKMEHSLRAPCAGTVAAVGGAQGSVVDTDAAIVTIAAAD